MLRFSNVTKVYPRSGKALDDVSFSLRRSEFAFLTGSSGAGKSTLLKLIYMEERPTDGEVLVGTTSSMHVRRKDIAQLRRRLGVVFQDFRLLETRTAEQNVAFALEVTGTPRSQIPSKVNRALSQVGLGAKAKAYPAELSGGEQQRVAIARALVNDPFLLIADEPTGNLDEKSTRSVFQLLKDISTSGTAVIVATHDLDLVRKSNYRNIELDHGRIIRDTDEVGTSLAGSDAEIPLHMPDPL
ncbi:MAG TPA: cell division ATP-binding protein FtsE [Gemmatimonadaceae bacterium]